MAKKHKSITLDFSEIADYYQDVIVDKGSDYIVIDLEGDYYIIEDIERHRDYGYLYQDHPLSDTKYVTAYKAKKVLKETYEKA